MIHYEYNGAMLLDPFGFDSDGKRIPNTYMDGDPVEHDWFTIQRDPWGDINGACVEGTAADMRCIAKAIRESRMWTETRCAVDATSDGRVELWSPRNSIHPTSVSREAANGLAADIDRKLGVGS